MSARFVQAAEQAKRFRDSMGLVFEALDYLSAMEDPAALEANITRLKRDGATIIAGYRKQAEDEAKRNMQAAVDAAGIKAKSILEEAEAKRTDIVKKAQAEANRIIADAQTAGEALTQKYAKAHEAARQALG